MISRFLLITCAMSIFSGAAFADKPDIKGRINVVFDTDVCLDIDDGMALAIVHALQDRHEANLVAVTVSIDERPCAPYLSALNAFYGHPDIPIGTVRNGLSQRSARDKMEEAVGLHTRGDETFADFILKKSGPDGSPVYPRGLADGTRAPEAVSLLREILTDQPDESVVMIQVGNSANFAALLDSRADAVSALSGLELITRKVRFISVMAGGFRDTKSGHTGVNIYEDVSSAKKIFDKWPTPIVVSGMEIGGAIAFPGISIENDFSYVSNHPISEAYRYSCATFLRASYPDWIRKCPHDHHTADLTATLYALRPDRNYFSLSKPGKITVLSSGNVRFDEDPKGTHRYLLVNDEQKIRAQEAMALLVSQPPVGLKNRISHVSTRLSSSSSE